MRKPIESTSSVLRGCVATVIWIDWYAYHLARFAGLQAAFSDVGKVTGIELVGGIGVHDGLKFREGVPDNLPIKTLLPNTSWKDAGKLRLSILLWKYLTALDPAVVLVPGYYTLPAIAAAIWAKTHGRVSVLMTESTAADHARTPWKESLKSILVQGLFDWAVTGGKAHVRYLVQLGFPEERIANFYDVVDNESLSRLTRSLRQQPATSYNLPKQYFLYVGRMAPEKNVSALLSSWFAYRAEGGGWPLVLAGDGPEMTSLKRQVARSQFAAEVHFTGHKRSAELPLLYAFAGCFILPSTREPWGLVVNEAMACSLPVLVSTACGCAEDLVASGINGFTFDPSNPASLTASLRQVADLDVQQRTAMGKSSEQMIRNYTPTNFGREIALIAEISQSIHRPLLAGSSVRPVAG